ncbi:hypothetical protein Tco_0609224 [Tanacetum coccineum]
MLSRAGLFMIPLLALGIWIQHTWHLRLGHPGHEVLPYQTWKTLFGGKALELDQSMEREIIREEFRQNHRRLWISLEDCDLLNVNKNGLLVVSGSGPAVTSNWAV